MTVSSGSRIPAWPLLGLYCAQVHFRGGNPDADPRFGSTSSDDRLVVGAAANHANNVWRRRIRVRDRLDLRNSLIRRALRLKNASTGFAL